MLGVFPVFNVSVAFECSFTDFCLSALDQTVMFLSAVHLLSSHSLMILCAIPKAWFYVPDGLQLKVTSD